MSTISHGSPVLARRNLNWLSATQVWASLAIVAMWMAVLFTAVFGADITSSNGVSGIGDRTTVPSAVAVALFAALATWPVARYGFRDGQRLED